MSKGVDVLSLGVRDGTSRHQLWIYCGLMYTSGSFDINVLFTVENNNEEQSITREVSVSVQIELN